MTGIQVLILKIILLFITAYIAGSVNFAILLFRLHRREDPRSKFSGNAGTTNVYRQAGKFWAAVIFLLDIGRSAAVAAVSLLIIESAYVPVIGFGLVLGNRLPCFHGFRGGKGVANFLGFTALLAPVWAGISAAVWLLVYLTAKQPFIASIFMVLVLAAGTLMVNGFASPAFAGVLTALFIIFNHKKNFIELKNKHETQD